MSKAGRMIWMVAAAGMLSTVGIARSQSAAVSAAVPAAAPAAAAAAASTAPDTRFVAGLQPFERPRAAPLLTAEAPDAAQASRRLKGIEGRPPPNVQRDAERAGSWFVPMFGPGMTAPYDLRGWHAPTR